MPSIGFGEILVILLVALLVFGPKKLPEMGKTVGKGLKEFRRAATEVRDELAIKDEPPTVPSPSVRKALEERQETTTATDTGGEETPPAPPADPD